MNIEAKYYKKIQNNKVKCTLCPHECILSLEKVGICRTRKNINNKLYSLAYSNPVAVNIDPVEKKPLYHFYPASSTFSIATAGCNLSCKNCQNSTISQISPAEIDSYDLPPEQVVEMAVKKNCKSISYTYTDPVVFYEYTLETAKLAHKLGLKNIIISAGYINQEPLLELIPFIDAANIDIKSFDDNLYRKINGAKLQPVLDTLQTLNESNVWLEITYLLIPGVNNSTTMIDKMCKWLVENGFQDTPLHFSRFYPTYKMLDKKSTSLSELQKAEKIAKHNGIKYVYIGNVTGNESENTYCSNCNKIIVSRNGYSAKKVNFIDGVCGNCGESIVGKW